MATAGDDYPPYMNTFNDVVILTSDIECPIVRNLRDDIRGSKRNGRQLRAEFIGEANWDTSRKFDIDQAIDNSVAVTALMSKDFVTDQEVLKYCSALECKLEQKPCDKGRGNIRFIPVYSPNRKKATYYNDLERFLKDYIHLDYDQHDPQKFLDKLWRTLQSGDSVFRRETIIRRLQFEYERSENEKKERMQKQRVTHAQEKARHEQQMKIIAEKSRKPSFVDTQVRGEHISTDDVVEDTNMSGGKLVEDSRQERSMSIDQPAVCIPSHMGDSTGHVVPMDQTSSLLTSDLDLRSYPPTSAMPRISTQNNGVDNPVTPPSQANTDDNSMIHAPCAHGIQTGGLRSVPEVNSPSSITKASAVTAGELVPAEILHSSGGNSLERQTAAAVATEADDELLASDPDNQTIPPDDSSGETLCKEFENISLDDPEHEPHVLDGARPSDSVSSSYPHGGSSISGSPSPEQEQDPVLSLGIRFPDEQRE